MTRRYVMEFERGLVELEEKLASVEKSELVESPELAEALEVLRGELAVKHRETYENLGPWQRVQISRHPDRPKTEDYLAALFDDVVEVHGDRVFGDDEAMFAGLATIGGRRVAVLGHRKGSNTKENVRRNFGSPHPEGFRKAMRVMRLADKFRLPIVSFLDTAGAFPGIEAEERGQAWAIAESIATLAAVRVPVVVVGIGEGGSGGALAIGFGDRIIMLQNSYYSVISPESCASILYRDANKAAEAAACLSLTASDLERHGLVDEVLPEPLEGAHVDPVPVIASVGEAVARALDELSGTDPDALVERRYERLRAIGEYADAG